MINNFLTAENMLVIGNSLPCHNYPMVVIVPNNIITSRSKDQIKYYFPLSNPVELLI